MDISSKIKPNINLSKLRAFLISEKFMIMLFAIAAFLTTFHLEIVALFIFAFVLSAIFVICDDLIASISPFLLVALLLIKCYDSYDIFIQYVWLVVPFVATLIFHFVHYRKKLVIGKCFWAIFAVSVSITIGGLGFLPLKNYLTLVSLYYVVGLGFGMLFVYVLLSSYLKAKDDYSLGDKFTNIMIIMGLFASFMILEFYIASFTTLVETRSILYMQWRNNLSTFLMFALPFAFFKAVKKPSFVFLAIAFYGCILLTGSRGGLIFGGIEFMMSLAILIGVDRKHRLPFTAIFIGIILAILVYFQDFYSFFGPTFDRLIMGLRGGEKEIRLQLFSRAFADFNRNPIFGTGLGYFGNRDVHNSAEFALCWYHCEPLQIIGSLGIVGVFAYILQLFVRCVVLLKRKTIFNITVFISYVGIEMMSLVNPGVFCPVPYLFLITLMIVVVEKCNQKDDEDELKMGVKENKHEQAFEPTKPKLSPEKITVS